VDVQRKLHQIIQHICGIMHGDSAVNLVQADLHETKYKPIALDYCKPWSQPLLLNIDHLVSSYMSTTSCYMWTTNWLAIKFGGS